MRISQSGKVLRQRLLQRVLRLVRPRLLLLAALAASTHGAYALQEIEGRDGVTSQARISIQEPTRIRIDSGAITGVVGNIYSANGCGPTSASTSAAGATPASAVNPLGDVVVECDRDKGEVYVKPVEPKGKPINLFVSAAGATYTLLLDRADMPADTIVIRDRSPKFARLGADGAPAASFGKSPTHIRALKGMLVAMASDRVPNDVQVEEVGRKINLWAESQFMLVRLYRGRGMVGEKYLLTNVSGKPMVLAEQEFDRADADVIGISVENHTLQPGESTSVYVIRGGS